MDGGYHARSRAGSFSGGYDASYRNPSPFPVGATSSAYGDPYPYDDEIMHSRRRHRSHSHSRSRRHSSSSHHRPIIAPQYGAGYGTNPMAIPGSAVPGTYGSYGGYGGGVSPYGQGLAVPVPMYTGSSMPSYGGGYAGSNVAPGTLIPSSRSHRHSFSGSHHDRHRRPRSASGYGY